MAKIKLGVIIGRFQPLHNGHVNLIAKAMERCDNLLILVGSANRPRSIKNPWTYKERQHELRKFVEQQTKITPCGVSIKPLNDYLYSDTQWIADVTEVVKMHCPNDNFKPREVVLFGFDKEGNDYLKWFPQYSYENVASTYEKCATDIRTQMYLDRSPSVPQSVQEDWDYFQKESKLFASYPYKATLNFNCADALVVCSGHVLLIQRKYAPGAGNWALPGGFKNANETFMDCAIRELYEETNLRVPEKVVRGSVVNMRLFDSPKRAPAGIPRNTMVVHIEVKPDADGGLPRASGADDAAMCSWVPIATAINQYKLHDDHGDIISIMTGVVPVPAHLN